MKKDYKNIRFSPEIEVEFPRDIDIGKFEETIEGWEIDFEYSLDHGLEYKPKKGNHLYYNQKSLNQIKKLLKLLKKHKCKMKSTCGLHIHIDITGFSKNKTNKIISKFIRYQDKIMKQFKVKRSRLTYCEKLICSCKEENIYSSKGTALSVSGFNTIEFRLFNGTLDYKTISKSIKWALQFIIA